MREKNPGTHDDFALVNTVDIDLGLVVLCLEKQNEVGAPIVRLASTLLLSSSNFAEFVHA